MNDACQMYVGLVPDYLGAINISIEGMLLHHTS